MKLILIILAAVLPGAFNLFFGKNPNAKGADDTAGIVYFSNDQGNTWQNHSAGLPGNIFLTDLAVGEGMLALASKRHGIFFFDPKDNTWKKAPGGTPVSSEVDALLVFNNEVVIGTREAGVFSSPDSGKSWTAVNTGLGDLAIRKLAGIGDNLFAGTNSGLFVLSRRNREWRSVYGKPGLQVNGIVAHKGELYIGTNQGAFKSTFNRNDWKPVLPNRSLHNISNAGKTLYALVYNELFASDDKGYSWRSGQQGMPAGKYTFQVIATGNTTLAGQWDGVYKKENSLKWTRASRGLPKNFPVTEMAVYRGIAIAASSAWNNH